MLSYRLLTGALAPFMPLWLRVRQVRGKEDPARLRERLGTASRPRPPGMLTWIHAASVGEANSILPFILSVRERHPQMNLLLTTGTQTSARLMERRLPKEVIHQYAPVDTAEAVHRFLRHWKPHNAIWVESELWPNLICATNRYECFMALLGGRMSERSYRGWLKRPAIVRPMLGSFDLVCAQSDNDAWRLKALGARAVLTPGNLKYDAALLPCDEDALLALRKMLQNRPVWLAASTHPGEEAMIARAHELMAATRPGLLTVIVPRHPERGESLAAELGKSLTVARRSQKQALTAETHIYLADTLGELGLFYRLADVVFMGGSLVKHGGQNPIEPARLSCALLVGRYTENFAGMYEELEKTGGCQRVTSPETLAAQAGQLIGAPERTGAMQDAVRGWMHGKGGATARILELMEPVFAPPRRTGRARRRA